MGLPGIMALMALNNARMVTGTLLPRPQMSPKNPEENAYGEQYREQIIRNVIRRARPRIWGVIGFDICPVNDASNVLNITRENDAYRLLRSYHCVNYWSIPRAIRRRIPELIREALTP